MVCLHTVDWSVGIGGTTSTHIGWEGREKKKTSAAVEMTIERDSRVCECECVCALVVLFVVVEGERGKG